MTLPTALALALAASAASTTAPVPPVRWGSDGHQMASRTAAETLPAEMPAFFRGATDQLVHLGPEPDRWRSRTFREMNEAWTYDHYIDIENVPAAALEATDRWVYVRMLYQAGLERPEADAGFLPFRTLEMYQRLVTEWRMWRAETDPARRAFIEARILNDAGILGHYVADGSNPHHTTIHFNGWAEGKPNPDGYTTSRDFHGRFESDFVRAHVKYQDVRSRVRGAPRSVAGAARKAIWEHVAASNAQVETLYRLEKEVGFDPAGPARPETRDFAVSRIVAGAEMLRTLWWSAWLESATAP